MHTPVRFINVILKPSFPLALQDANIVPIHHGGDNSLP